MESSRCTICLNWSSEVTAVTAITTGSARGKRGGPEPGCQVADLRSWSILVIPPITHVIGFSRGGARVQRRFHFDMLDRFPEHAQPQPVMYSPFGVYRGSESRHPDARCRIQVPWAWLIPHSTTNLQTESERESHAAGLLKSMYGPASAGMPGCRGPKEAASSGKRSVEM